MVWGGFGHVPGARAEGHHWRPRDVCRFLPSLFPGAIGFMCYGYVGISSSKAHHRVTGDQNGESGIISTGAGGAEVSALGPRSTAGAVSSVVMISLLFERLGKLGNT